MYSAVRTLAALVHPTQPQWRPIRALPFQEAAIQWIEQTETVATAAVAAAATSGLAIDVKAAAKLGASVWRETSTHLLKTAKNGISGERVVERSGAGAGNEEARRGGGQNQSVGKAVAPSALSVLCSIVREEGSYDGLAAAARDSEKIDVGDAPFSGECLRGVKASHHSDDTSTARLAALRVLLHTCRASSSVAHAFAAFHGGAAVQALLGRLCLPEGNTLGGKVRRRKRTIDRFCAEACRVHF